MTAGSLRAESPTALARNLAELLASREAAHDREGAFAATNVEDVRDAGLLALTVPSSAGGFGADLRETVDTLRLLAWGAPSTALMLAIHTSTVANFLLDPAAVPESERDYFLRQRDLVFAEAVEGRIFAVANSEPGAQGDVHNSRARAARRGDTFAVTGIKSFASFGTNADYYMVAARDESNRVDYYLVRNDGAAVTRTSEWSAVGMRSSESAILSFDSAPSPGILGYRGMVDGANNRHWSTLSLTAIFVGIAESLLGEVSKLTNVAAQETALIDFYLSVQAARAFLDHAVASEPPPPAPSSYKRLVRDCKTFVTRSLAQSASSLYTMQSGGAYAFSSPISRKYRDLLAGPMLRPPIAVAYEEIGRELKARV